MKRPLSHYVVGAILWALVALGVIRAVALNEVPILVACLVLAAVFAAVAVRRRHRV